MNIQQLANGEHLLAEYHEYDGKTKKYQDNILFRCKSYGDVSGSERRNQVQAGNLSSKFSISIQTTSNLPFKVKDKIKLLKGEREYQVTGVETKYDSVNSLSNQLFPNRKGNNPVILHLNKDDV